MYRARRPSRRPSRRRSRGRAVREKQQYDVTKPMHRENEHGKSCTESCWAWCSNRVVGMSGSRVSASSPGFPSAVCFPLARLLDPRWEGRQIEREREKERERFLEARARAHVNSSRCDCRGTRRGTKANENTGLDVPLAFTSVRQLSPAFGTTRHDPVTPTATDQPTSGRLLLPHHRTNKNDPAAFVLLLLSTLSLSLLSSRTLAALLFPRCLASCFSNRDFALFSFPCSF